MLNCNDISLTENLSLSTDFNISELPMIVNENTSIILFGYENDKYKMFSDFHLSKNFDKLIVITQKKQYSIKKRLYFSYSITKSILEHVKKNLLIFINIDNNYMNTKHIIKELIELKKLAELLNINLGINYEGENVFGFISNNESIYFNDVINALRCIYISDKLKKYEYIYNTVCDYLDEQFKINNFCVFHEDDSCVNNRKENSIHSTMGCCYSFEYTNFFSPTFIKNVKLCKYMNCKSCSTKCITCKMFTCKYLKQRGIYFNCNNILLLDCFFNKKQHLILESNFFRTREMIIKKLMEENHDLYFVYYLFKKYAI